MNLALSNALIDLLLGLPARDWNKHLLGVQADEEADAKRRTRQEDLGRRPDRTPTVPLDRLAGAYADDAYGEANVRNTDGALVWEWGSWKVPLEHYAGDTFRMKSDYDPLNGIFVRFVVADGAAHEMRLPVVTFRRKDK